MKTFMFVSKFSDRGATSGGMGFGEKLSLLRSVMLIYEELLTFSDERRALRLFSYNLYLECPQRPSNQHKSPAMS